ncbi:MAG: tetratricopeptide repeat protein [Deltaproteobacteria bacterium]|nr:MAG: tetratricopeptide repeat protein [Deltaproteobacteria bacterium]
MRYILLTVVFLAWLGVTTAVQAEEDACARADSYFSKGAFSKGLSILNKVYAGKDLSTEQRAEIMKKFAQFYEGPVGNYDKALFFYRKIVALDLPQDHPLKSNARQGVTRIMAHAKEFSREVTFLKRMRLQVTNPEEIEERITDLQALIHRRPDSPSIASAYYYLGSNLLSLERYGEAERAFRKALELRPAMDFSQPVSRKRRIAYRNWLRTNAARTAWGIMGLILPATALVFFLSKPWRWLGIPHLGGAAALALLWWLVFYVASKWAAHHIPEPSLEFAQPSFVTSLPGSPGSEVLGKLYLYGLVGLLGVFLFAVGTARFRLRWTAMMLNGTIAALLFGSLMVAFYLRYCDGNGVYQRGKGKLSILTGAVFMERPDIGPDVLINPRAYPGLYLKDIDDPVMRQWIKAKYEEIASLNSEGEDGQR